MPASLLKELQLIKDKLKWLCLQSIKNNSHEKNSLINKFY